MAAINYENPKLLIGIKGVGPIVQWDQPLVKIALCYTFLDKWHFSFPPKFKMAVEIQKSLNFSEVLEE